MGLSLHNCDRSHPQITPGHRYCLPSGHTILMHIVLVDKITTFLFSVALRHNSQDMGGYVVSIY